MDASPTARKPPNSLVRSAGLFVLLTVVVASLCQWIWTQFPNLRNGTRIIVEAKRDAMRAGALYPPDSKADYRVAFFGNSRVLAGFVPDQFDELSEGRTLSYNLGMPGEPEFIPRIEEMIAAGNRPTHVFLILSWPEGSFQPTVWKWFESDQKLIDAALPFAPLAKDLLAFAARAPGKGGWKSFYRYSEQSARDTLSARGYYFIESQSLFADHRLPDDYRLPTDRPKDVDARRIVAAGLPFNRLARLAEAHDFIYVLVPNYRREFQIGVPPAINQETQEALKSQSRFLVLGPDYYRYPNKLFADRVHLNPEGARVYTEDLWKLTRPLFDKKNPSPPG